MIYLRSFRLSDRKLNCPNIYPYNVFRGREGLIFYLDRITVLYGNNGSGKSTLLNVIANKLRIEGKEYAVPNSFGSVDYCTSYVNECRAGLGEDEFGRNLRSIPKDSRYIKSEDILYEIKKIWQAEILKESMVVDMVRSGQREQIAMDFLESPKGRREIERQEFCKEKYSNGETSLEYFDTFIRPDGLYLLDEPEVSLSPDNQVLLAGKINEMARLLDCQFVIATHSPFMLGSLDAKIYDLDSSDYRVADWTELPNVRYFRDFFREHDHEFSDE